MFNARSLLPRFYLLTLFTLHAIAFVYGSVQFFMVDFNVQRLKMVNSFDRNMYHMDFLYNYIVMYLNLIIIMKI